jgi:CheY-specific phosphatase CheX
MTTNSVLAPEVEQALRQPARGMPRAEHLEPFLTGAREVLETELGVQVERGALRLEAGSHTTQDVTAIVGITGQLTGLAVYGMSRETAVAVVGQRRVAQWEWAWAS